MNVCTPSSRSKQHLSLSSAITPRSARPLFLSFSLLHHHHQRPSVAPWFSPFTKVTVRCGVSRDKIVVKPEKQKKERRKKKQTLKVLTYIFCPVTFLLLKQHTLIQNYFATMKVNVSRPNIKVKPIECFR